LTFDSSDHVSVISCPIQLLLKLDVQNFVMFVILSFEDLGLSFLQLELSFHIIYFLFQVYIFFHQLLNFLVASICCVDCVELFSKIKADTWMTFESSFATHDSSINILDELYFVDIFGRMS